MSPFAFGLLLGIAVAAILAAVAAVYSYRRFILLERRTREAERLAEIGTLTGGLAHEIKNPLSTVGLNLQLLQEDLDPKTPNYPRLASRLATVRGETARLRAILDDFLRFAGRIELARQPTELNELLDELADFFSPQAQVQGTRLRVSKSGGPVIADVDPKLLKQAILNLMINALQAMPEGGELILSLASAAGDATITVTDTGPGISPDAITRIFHAYFTTKRGGTGLGLAMAKRIVEEHGGRLTVQSEQGKGSQFQIRLPLRAHPAHTKPAPAPSQKPIDRAENRRMDTAPSSVSMSPDPISG
jgi:signal transduction histidine kinase